MSHLYTARPRQPDRGPSTNVFRLSRRDVFSNEEVDESVAFKVDSGYDSSGSSNAESLHLISQHYQENIDQHVACWDDSRHGNNNSRPPQPHPMSHGDGDDDDDMEGFSMCDDETLIATSHHTRPIPQSDLEQPRLTPDDSDTTSSHHSFNSNSTQSRQDTIVVNVHLQDFPPIQDPQHAQKQRQHRRKMIFLATLALCLVLLVAAISIIWWVLGVQQDQRNDISIQPTIQPSSPSSPPTPTATTTATATPTFSNNSVHQWAQLFLPKYTLQSIQQQPNPNTTAATPQSLAFDWIQTDPYFVRQNESNTTQNHNYSIQELSQKRLQRFALATFYYATGGRQWGQPQSDYWLSPQDECQWAHFHCARITNTSRHLQQLPSTLTRNNQGTTLQLQNVSLAGTLPPQIGLLSDLSMLVITTMDEETNNRTTNGTNWTAATNTVGLHGTLPSQLGFLTDLTLLDLHNNGLTGTIPSQLGLLTNLQKLYLHNNSFLPNGSVPPQLCYMGSLRELTVDCASIVCTCSSCLCNGPAIFVDHHNATAGHGNIFGHAASVPPTIDIPNATTGPLTHSPTITTTTSTGLTLTPTNSSNPTNATTNNSSSAIGNYNTARTMMCNGLPNTCDLRLNQVLTPMVHNAMATSDDGFYVANHAQSLEKAVQAGFRGLSLDVCRCNNQLVFCHSLCSLGNRSIPPVLEFLHRFLLQYPDEILILNFQVDPDENGIPIDLMQFYKLMQDVGNFTEYIYQHNPVDNSTWPTLRTLIESDKRVVMFHLNGPNCRQGQGCPPGMHYYFDYAAETEFEFPQLADLLNTSSSCQITRGNANRTFFGINNFLQLPAPDLAPTLNAWGFLQQRVDACRQANGGIQASLLYVDHWSVGDVLAYALVYNAQLGSGSTASQNQF